MRKELGVEGGLGNLCRKERGKKGGLERRKRAASYERGKLREFCTYRTCNMKGQRMLQNASAGASGSLFNWDNCDHAYIHAPAQETEPINTPVRVKCPR